MVPSGSFEDKMNWFREIFELQNETQDASEFMESLKMDFSRTSYMYLRRKGK